MPVVYTGIYISQYGTHGDVLSRKKLGLTEVQDFGWKNTKIKNIALTEPTEDTEKSKVCSASRKERKRAGLTFEYQ